MEVINGTSLQFYLLIRKKLDIKPLWIAKKCQRKTLAVVLKFQRNGNGKAEGLNAKGREGKH